MHDVMCTMASMDRAQIENELKTVGAKRIRLDAQLAELKPGLDDLIRRAHAAGVEQQTIAEWTGYRRDNIRLITMTPQERDAYNARRRARTAQQDLDDASPELVAQIERTATDPSSRVRAGRPRRSN